MSPRVVAFGSGFREGGEFVVPEIVQPIRIIIGGIGSVRGAFIAAIIVGLVDTLGRVFLPAMLRLVVDQATADGAGPAVASMLVYIIMAVVLIFRPTGLFPAKG